MHAAIQQRLLSASLFICAKLPTIIHLNMHEMATKCLFSRDRNSGKDPHWSCVKTTMEILPPRKRQWRRTWRAQTKDTTNYINHSPESQLAHLQDPSPIDSKCDSKSHAH